MLESGGEVVEVVDEGAGHVVLRVSGAAGGPVQAKLPVAQLADHPMAVRALVAALVPGVRLAPLLVLERLEGQKLLLVRRWRPWWWPRVTLPKEPGNAASACRAAHAATPSPLLLDPAPGPRLLSCCPSSWGCITGLVAGAASPATACRCHASARCWQPQIGCPPALPTCRRAPSCLDTSPA